MDDAEWAEITDHVIAAETAPGRPMAFENDQLRDWYAMVVEGQCPHHNAQVPPTEAGGTKRG